MAVLFFQPGCANLMLIADVNHYRHCQQWCSFFFQAGAPFSIENARLWPVLAILGYFFLTNLRTFWCPFYRPKKCDGAPKLTAQVCICASPFLHTMQNFGFFGQFWRYALFGAPFTGLSSAVVPNKCQILGLLL